MMSPHETCRRHTSSGILEKRWMDSHQPNGARRSQSTRYAQHQNHAVPDHRLQLSRSTPDPAGFKEYGTEENSFVSLWALHINDIRRFFAQSPKHLAAAHRSNQQRQRHTEKLPVRRSARAVSKCSRQHSWTSPLVSIDRPQ